MATLSNQKLVLNVPFTVETGYYTAVVPGATITHTHLGHETLAPSTINFTVTEKPASGDICVCYWDESANDLTNGTVAFIFDTTAGGDLTSVEIKYTITWYSATDGGIS